MNTKDDDMLARFIVLENLVAAIVSRHPARAEVIADFDAFATLQAALQAVNGMPPAFGDAIRYAHANLLRLATAKAPGPPAP
jgi:hypothetical protein